MWLSPLWFLYKLQMHLNALLSSDMHSDMLCHSVLAMTQHDPPVRSGGHGCQRKEILFTHMASTDAQLQHQADVLQEIVGRVGNSPAGRVHVSAMESRVEARGRPCLHPNLVAHSARQGA